MHRLLPALLLLIGVSTALAKPEQRRPSDMERGKELYDRHCMACHGVKNHGDGPATEALVADVPDLEGKVKADDATVKLVLAGSGAMPSYEASFDAADARRVLKYMAEAHIKGTPPKAIDPNAKADPKEDEEEEEEEEGEEGGDGQTPDAPPAEDGPPVKEE